eukprot:224467_1
MSAIETINRWAYTLSYLSYLTILPFLHVTYPQYVNLLLLVGFMFNFMDFVVSNAPYKNLETMNKNGISNTRAILYMVLNLFIYQTVWILISRLILNSINIVYYFDIWLIFKIAITLTFGEIYFFYGHKALHETEFGAKIHLLHHCGMNSSLSTGLMFNPLDIIIEFAGPNLVLLFMYFITMDACLLVVGGCIILGWYGAEHDENLQLHHYDHHKYCDSDYTAYIRYKDHCVEDKIRKILKR